MKNSSATVPVVLIDTNYLLDADAVADANVNADLDAKNVDAPGIASPPLKP